MYVNLSFYMALRGMYTSMLHSGGKKCSFQMVINSQTNAEPLQVFKGLVFSDFECGVHL